MDYFKLDKKTVKDAYRYHLLRIPRVHLQKAHKFGKSCADKNALLTQRRVYDVLRCESPVQNTHTVTCPLSTYSTAVLNDVKILIFSFVSFFTDGT